MSLCKVFPRVLAACFALSLFAVTASARQTTTRPRQAGDAQQQQKTVTTTDASGRPRLENDLSIPYVVSESEEEEEPASSRVFTRPANLGQFERQMLDAIEDKLGVPYRMGSEGPYRYDCSGFVWSVFRESGVEFERGSARNLWSSFAPASEGEKFKFGTLVFFNNLKHVGIVADEGGFYHASTSRGVVYSPFSEYWTKRITGFRRVPLAQATTLIASSGR